MVECHRTESVWLRLKPPAFPHHAADHLHLLAGELQRAVSGVIADQRDHSRPPGIEPLNQQRIAAADHMDAIAPRPRRAIDQDLVAVAQGGLHRIAFDPDR